MSFIKMSYADLKTAKSDNGWRFYYVEEITNTHFNVYCGDRHSKFFSVVKGSDATDFVNNHKSAATSVASEGLAMSKINSGLFHIFDDEALTTTYESSETVGCDSSKKTFTIENKNATNAINYRVWGSANGTDFELIINEQLLALSSKESVVNNDFWKFVKVEAKAFVGTATVDVWLQVGA